MGLSFLLSDFPMVWYGFAYLNLIADGYIVKSKEAKSIMQIVSDHAGVS